MKKELYTTWNQLSAMVMILALLWLTVSLPFINDARQQLLKQAAALNLPGDTSSDNNDDCGNPLSNTNEEKAEGNSSLLEEFLHNHHEGVSFEGHFLSHFDKHNQDLYVAFHGELLSPPPESYIS